MDESIIVAYASLDEGRRLCAMLGLHRYIAIPLDSLDAVAAILAEVPTGQGIELLVKTTDLRKWRVIWE
ncbi:MAG: hypothetical protein ACP5SH_06395 [Syntrophobacteraceae bacterium]